jgi:hypothetical protein
MLIFVTIEYNFRLIPKHTGYVYERDTILH